MNNLLAAIDAFSNPDSVWYYVVGVLFLVLIFAALAVYVVLSNKKKKAQEDAAENTEDVGDEKGDATAEADAGEEVKTDDSAPVDEKADERPIAEHEAATAEKTKEPAPSASAKSDESNAPVEKTEQTEKPSEPEPEKSEPVEKTAAKKSAPKKAAAKPFIDRLLATKSVHGVYNELKNTVLSYPGMKAKLTKDDEQFVYVDKKMAAVTLDGERITLYLALDKAAVPSGFEVQKADGDFGIKTEVAETDIDSARKLIVFAMNVSMLTRNDKKRYVDYIQKAKDAKQRAKKK